MEERLTHINSKGQAHMVDVSGKAETRREAVAEGFVIMQPETLTLLLSGSAKKGDVLGAARIAGIMAAKRTSELIPLCHPLPIEQASLELDPLEPDRVRIRAKVACVYRTGAEMEALTAVSVAALTVYDMLKAADRGMTIGNIRLLEKSGGKSGVYQREE